VGDGPAAIHQRAHLAARLEREGRQLARELLREQALRRQVAPLQTLELPDLAGLEAVCVAEDADEADPRSMRAFPRSI